jgi:hypothetical protein
MAASREQSTSGGRSAAVNQLTKLTKFGLEARLAKVGESANAGLYFQNIKAQRNAFEN